jgi:hypothetical protein
VDPASTAGVGSALEVRRIVVARGVENHEPVGVASRFVLDGTPLYAFMELSNPTSERQEIVVTFERTGGTAVGHVHLNVPAHASRYRTWALSRMVNRPGEWTAVVRTVDGELLDELAFTVES